MVVPGLPLYQICRLFTAVKISGYHEYLVAKHHNVLEQPLESPPMVILLSCVLLQPRQGPHLRPWRRWASHTHPPQRLHHILLNRPPTWFAIPRGPCPAGWFVTSCLRIELRIHNGGACHGLFGIYPSGDGVGRAGGRQSAWSSSGRVSPSPRTGATIGVYVLRWVSAGLAFMLH